MAYLRDKLYPKSVKRKILSGFLLAFVAILLALGITHFGFNEMLETVHKLSAPNRKLNALNSVFQEITSLDQQQRAEAIRNPKKPYKDFLNQSKTLVDKIDSLSLLRWDSTQMQRLVAIRKILQKRNGLFFSYLKLKSNMMENRTLSIRLDTLSTILEKEKIVIDTNVVTTEKKTVTTYYKDSVQKDNRSRISKLFSKKKNNPPPTTQVKVQEELKVTVDTLSIARQNKAMEEVEKIMIDLEKDQRAENKKLLQQELALINANSALITQLLGILHEVESEELAQLRRNNADAVTLVTQSISRISLLLLIFFLGAALLVYLIWLDISRSNYYKEQLEKARDEAEELSQIKQRFLANMSHEIRTPLQSIIGFSEQLKNKGAGDREAVAAIHSSSEHLLHIVDEVLDYSRISSGNLTFEKENFRLLSVVHEVESALRVQAERKKLTLLFDAGDAADVTLSGDSFRLRQVLYNLMGNAIKFTAKGYVKLTVKTLKRNDGIHCTFEVSDTGIGIRADDLKKIFNQFEQASATIARHYGGTGLGLTIVKSLVEAQGGTLDVDSEPGQGSTFRVQLRFDVATDEAPAQAILAKTETKGPVGKVIVVDDDTMILRLCDLILTKAGVHFTTYNDAQRVIHLKPDNAVTHILMDIRMPHINGIELCHELKNKYKTDTIFVALTAHVFPQERQQLLDEGFDAVLSKPFREQELLGLLGIDTAAVQHDSDKYLSTLKMMTMGDDALFQSVLAQFVDETQSDLEKIDIHLKHMDATAVREVVHKLAGRIGQVGSVELSGRLRDVEMQLADDEPLTAVLEKLVVAKDDVEQMLASIRVSVLAQ